MSMVVSSRLTGFPAASDRYQMNSPVAPVPHSHRLNTWVPNVTPVRRTVPPPQVPRLTCPDQIACSDASGTGVLSGRVSATLLFDHSDTAPPLSGALTVDCQSPSPFARIVPVSPGDRLTSWLPA